MNVPEKIADLLVVAVILFLFPLLYYGSIVNVSASVMAGQAGKNFLKRVSTAGEITLPVWKELEDTLHRCGCERFELRRERSLYERDSATGDMIEQKYSMEKASIEKQLAEQGSCPLLKGDWLRLVIEVNSAPILYLERIRTGVTDG